MSQTASNQQNTAHIRKLLTSAFSDEELTSFCFDHYREVYDKFAAGMSFQKKVQFLIEYCERRRQTDQLLQLVDDYNPAQSLWFGLSPTITNVPPTGQPILNKPEAKGYTIIVSFIVAVLALVVVIGLLLTGGNLLRGTLGLFAQPLPVAETTPTLTLGPTIAPSPLNFFTQPVQVRMRDTGEMIPGATVSLNFSGLASLSAITGADGSASIFVASAYIGLPCQVMVSAPGYQEYRLELNLVEGALPGLIELERLPPPTPILFEPSPTPIVPPAPTDTPIPSTFTPAPADTPVPPTFTLTPTDTPAPVSIPTATSVPIVQGPMPTLTLPPTTATATRGPVIQSGSNLFQPFEQDRAWKRGKQPYGTFGRSTAQVASGAFAGELRYDFPAVADNFVVFQQAFSLPGSPTSISAQVYGDKSGHFMNVWLKDADEEVWQMTFGPIQHSGWLEMVAVVDNTLPWPTDLISGTGNGTIDYPISFEALVLDGVPDGSASKGVIYIDDLQAVYTETSAASTPSPVTESPPPPPPSSLSGRIAFPTDNGGGQYDVWMLDVSSRQSFMAIKFARQPNFSKGGWLVANGDTYNEKGYNLLLVNSELKVLDIISESPADEYPFWEPTGNRLVYSNATLLDGKPHVFIQCSSAKRPQYEQQVECQDIITFGTLLDEDDHLLVGDAPVWTDTDFIAFRRRFTGRWDGINLLPSWSTLRYEGGQEPILLVPCGQAIPSDTYGNYLYFFALDLNGNPGWEVYSVDLSSRQVVNLSNSSDAMDGLPTISPDGSWVAFVSNRDGRWAIWLVPAVGGGTPQKLADFPKVNPWGGAGREWFTERISWGPD